MFKIKDRLPNQICDEDILAKLRSDGGNLDLLGQLYSRYMHLVYGVCLKYLRNRDESMDAVMQIFEKLIIEIPKQKIDNFRSWLHVVTKNYCLMKIRSEKARNEKTIEWMSNNILFMENEYFLHPIDEDEQKKEKLLMDCIEKLKYEQKECIKQFYYNDSCYSEIAANMNIDEKKVKSYLQNAKRNLKLCIERNNA
jgi:RNA polymerase sigma-70 factor, ECF subfamily